MLYYTNSFFPNKFEKSDDKVLLKIFQKLSFIKVKMGKIYCVACKKCKDLKNPQISYLLDKTFLLCSICDKCGKVDEKDSIEISKCFGLINNM